MDIGTDDEQEAWQSFVRGRNAAAREAMIARYSEFARMHAAKLFAARQVPDVEFDEFRQYALIGLIEAVDRYDPDGGASFRTYASHRIRGAVLSGIEKHCEKQQQIAARSRIREERFRELLVEVGAAQRDPFLQLVDLALGTAIGYMLEDSQIYQAEEGIYEHNIYRGRELRDLARVLEGIVGSLPPTEQTIIREHYFRQMRFDEIATRMGLSKGRISQLHHRALQRIREHCDQLHMLRTDY